MDDADHQEMTCSLPPRRWWLFAMLLIGTPLRAADLSPALEALAAGQTDVAVARLTASARGGDPVAAYDLALALERQGGDPAQVDLWLREAARHGLVQA